PAHDPQLRAGAATAEEAVRTVGFEPRHADARRHVEALAHLARVGIDATQLARVVLPCAVPELAVDPGHAGDEAIRLDRTQHGPGVGIDLVDPAVAPGAHPEAAFGPGEARAPGRRRRDRGEDVAGFGIDLPDAVAGDLEEVPAVERGARVGHRLERAQHLARFRLERIQARAGREPHPRAVVAHAVDGLDVREGAVLPDDFRCASVHAVRL